MTRYLGLLHGPCVRTYDDRKLPLGESFVVDVTIRGHRPGAADYAMKRIGLLGRIVDRPVLSAQVRLTEDQDRAVARPVVAQANLDVDGQLVCAQVDGACTVDEAAVEMELLEYDFELFTEPLPRSRCAGYLATMPTPCAMPPRSDPVEEYWRRR